MEGACAYAVCTIVLQEEKRETVKPTRLDTAADIHACIISAINGIKQAQLLEASARPSRICPHPTLCPN
jgi:hypothetical protein